MEARFLHGFSRHMTRLPFAGKAMGTLVVLMLWGFFSVAQTPVISVRFNNPAYDCKTQTYCVDVEFNANTPGLKMYDMNVRFFYETNVLQYVSTGNFAKWYIDRKAPMPYITPENGGNFGVTGNVTYWNGSVYLVNPLGDDFSTGTGIVPISNDPLVWTRLFSLCFKVLDPSAFSQAGICPMLIWDLEADPLKGGFGDQSDGVVITYLNPGTTSGYLSALENVVQYNWQYDADPTTVPYGSKTSTNCLQGDEVPPVIATTAISDDLGCNPTVVAPLFSATDNCDPLVTPVVTTDGPSGDGCTWSQTWTANCSDASGNPALPVVITYTWKVDTELPLISTLDTDKDLGCNPDLIALPLFTGIDNCDGIFTPDVTNNGPVRNGCSVSQSWLANYTDACGNKAATVSVTYTWKEDRTAPLLAGVPQGGELGCNPQNLPACAPGVTANDICDGTVGVICTPGIVNETGTCGRSQTFVYSATDLCGNTASSSVTYTWTVTTAPVLANLPAGGNLGCNPTVLPVCSTAVTASNECGAVAVTCTPGAIVNSGTCGKSRTFTYTATSCGLTSTQDVTYTWTEDTTPPVLTGCPATPVELGINPVSAPQCADALALISAVDACSGALTPACVPGAVIPSGCRRTQSFTLTATDGCLNSASCVVTFTWTIDTGTPEFVNCPSAPIQLGCNPELPDCLDALAQVTAVDGCSGPILPVCTPGLISENGCGRSQTFTMVATNNTGKSATCTVTFAWTEDTTLPVIATTAQNQDLGCSPQVVPPVFTASDNCEGTVIPVVTTAGPTHAGCAWSQTWTANYTDGCGNRALPVSITYTWTIDTELPVITTTAQSGDLGCNPVIVAPVFRATDNCQGTVTPILTAEAVGGSDCYYRATYTATYTDRCGNQAVPVSITWTWKQDLVPPVFTAPSDVTIASDQNCLYNANPDITGWATGLSDDCMVTPTMSYSDVVTPGPVQGTRLLTRTWTATDGCNNKTVRTQLITITGGAPPELSLHNHCVYLNEYGKWTLNSWDKFLITQGSSGGCGVGSLNFTFSPASFNCVQAGKDVTVLVMATDVAGNVVSGTVKVTVADTIAPVAVCKDITVTLDAIGQFYVTQNMVNNGSSDNCSVSGLFMDKQLFTKMNIGVNEVLLVAKDPSGNAGTCKAKVTVLDTPKLGVNIVNKAPTIANVEEVKIVNEPLSLDIPLTSISAGEGNGTTQKVVSVTAVSDNTSLVKGLEVVYTAGSATGKLLVTIAGGMSGSAIVTLTVKDDGGTENGGKDTYSISFRIMVEQSGAAVYVTVFDQSGVATITSVTDVNREFSAKLWPNPTTGPVNIAINWGDVQQAEVSVFNILGVEVYRNRFYTGELIRFDLAGKASGVYMVKIQGGDRSVVKKVTVDRR